MHHRQRIPVSKTVLYGFEALDILQGEDNCFYGTVLPIIEALMVKKIGTERQTLPNSIWPACCHSAGKRVFSCSVAIFI